MARDPRKSIPAPAAYLRVLVRRFGATPERYAAMFYGVDLDAARLAQPGVEATLFTFVTVGENLCRMEGEHWPLEALHTFEYAMQGALEVAVRSAPSVADGLDVVADFGVVRGPQFLFRATRSRTGARLTVAPAVAMSEEAWRSFCLVGALSVASLLKVILQGDVHDLGFDFPFPAPRYAQRLREALPGSVRFDRRECAITLPAALANRASPFADACLLATALAELERAKRAMSGDDVLKLRINQLLSLDGRLSADRAAALLGVSRRTLVRRLAEARTSFRELLDAALRERASAMLGEGRLSRDDMAEALGFRDPTSFSRACRRWFAEH